MEVRWEGDERGQGVADAGRLVSGANELLEAFREPAWVAEQPNLHLRPHIEAWCEADPRLALTEARIDDSAAYVLDLSWRGAPTSVGEARAAVFALIGSFAESATYVRQRRVPGNGQGVPMRLRFEVGTGELGSDARFASHGHVVVINLVGDIGLAKSTQ
jgi:hypothetical protein